MFWQIRQRLLDLSQRAQVMGILNTTPDSFSDGGKYLNLENALLHAREMIDQGAVIVDVGGESTRPGSLPISAEEEIRRTIPLIKSLRNIWDGFISIDTSKAIVARKALEEGVDIVNDVSGLTADPEMLSVCRDSDCGIVIMHKQGNPISMQQNPFYEEVVSEVQSYFLERLDTLVGSGIAELRICFDPGIGFGKTLENNLALLSSANRLAPKNRPFLLGVSRKSLITQVTPVSSMQERDAATHAFTSMARTHGIMLHRVHDVAGNLTALRMVEALLSFK